MAKAGLFAGEITSAAPANGAATTKQNGYHWMQWGSATPPPDKKADDLIREAGPAAMYTFQDPDFNTTLIDEMGVYDLTTVINSGDSAPVPVLNPWRSTNSQYCQMTNAAQEQSGFVDTRLWEAGNLMFDVASGLMTDFTLIWGIRITDADFSNLKFLLGARTTQLAQKFSIFREVSQNYLLGEINDSAQVKTYGSWYGASDNLSDGLPHIISFRKSGTLLEFKADNRDWQSTAATTPYFYDLNDLTFKIGANGVASMTTLSCDHDVGAVYGKALTREQIDLIHSTYRNEII